MRLCHSNYFKGIKIERLDFDFFRRLIFSSEFTDNKEVLISNQNDDPFLYSLLNLNPSLFGFLLIFFTSKLLMYNPIPNPIIEIIYFYKKKNIKLPTELLDIEFSTIPFSSILFSLLASCSFIPSPVSLTKIRITLL